jgi:hypothetical protein
LITGSATEAYPELGESGQEMLPLLNRIVISVITGSATEAYPELGESTITKSLNILFNIIPLLAYV